jgi:hypothetical protein
MKLWTVDARGEALKHLEGRSEGSTPRARDLEWSDPLPLFASAVARGLAVEAGDAETQVFRIVDVCWESSTLRQRWRAEVANLHPGYARVLANLLRAPGCDAIMVTETDGTDGHSRPLDLAVPYPRRREARLLNSAIHPPNPKPFCASAAFASQSVQRRSTRPSWCLTLIYGANSCAEADSPPPGEIRATPGLFQRAPMSPIG